MPITRKPKPHSPSPLADPLELINRGGSSPTREKPKPYEGTVAVVLRIPSEMLRQVDSLVQSRPVRIPRHTWILEAVLEKLSREQAASAENR